MQIYGKIEGFLEKLCIAWVGNIITPVEVMNCSLKLIITMTPGTGTSVTRYAPTRFGGANLGCNQRFLVSWR